MLSIDKVWVPSNTEWDETWVSCPYSTYFHGRDWAEIWEEYTHGEISPAPIGLHFSDGLDVIFPFSKETFHRLITKRMVSSPGGTYGGWISRSHLDVNHQTVLIDFLQKKYRDLLWRINPYEPVAVSDTPMEISVDETMVIDLSHGLDEVLQHWSRGCISATKKAQKAGVEVYLAETTDDWNGYFDMYVDSINRWGEKATSNYRWDLFQIIQRHSSKNRKLWLARYDGKLIAGALCFYSPSQAIYWHGAAYSRYFDIRPVNLIMYEAIKNSIEMELAYFDFNPSGGHSGVTTFKSRFGAKPKASNIFVYRSQKMRILSTMISILRKNEEKP